MLYNGFASEGENFISTDGFNVPNGFYVLSIQSNSKFLSEKIIIELMPKKINVLIKPVNLSEKRGIYSAIV